MISVTLTPLQAAQAMANILNQERETSKLRLLLGWIVFKNNLWRWAGPAEIPDELTMFITGPDPRNENSACLDESTLFESFEEWLDHVCDDPRLGIGQYSTLKSLTVSFATGLAPWLEANVVEYQGQRLTPELFLEQMSFGKYSDCNTAWWQLFKKWRAEAAALVAAEGESGPEFSQRLDNFSKLQRELDDRLLFVADLVLDEKVTRDDVDVILKHEGFRQTRGQSNIGSWPWVTVPKEKLLVFAIRIPPEELHKVKEELWMYLMPEPSRPEDVLP